MHIKTFIFFSIILLFFASCKKDKIPAYIKINPFTISSNPNLNGSEGELSFKIDYVWVYANQKIIGVFNLPIEIPILEEGKTDITLFPGINLNGISATKGIYPMYKAFDTTINLSPNQNYSISPSTQYQDELTFRIEDFENFTNIFTEIENSSASIKNSNQEAIYGSKCGRVILNNEDSILNVKTNWNVNLPKKRPVFLEIDYKIENNILISTEAGNSTGKNVSPYIELNSSSANSNIWKKIYIALEENVSFETNATFYNIILTSIFSKEKNNSTLLIDNVKLVYAL